MQVPLELAFHHVDPTEWAEADIRERVAKLEKVYDRIISARVRVERQAHNAPPVVHIELGIPGRADIVVAQADHLQRKFQSPDLKTAIAESFRIAERRLFELKEKQLQVQTHETAERTAQYAAHTERLEQRVRVLERIITDKGMAISDEIESLREKPLN